MSNLEHLIENTLCDMEKDMKSINYYHMKKEYIRSKPMIISKESISLLTTYTRYVVIYYTHIVHIVLNTIMMIIIRRNKICQFQISISKER